MNWGQFVRHNRWQKLTAFLLAVLIWLTVARKLRNGGGVRLTFDGSSRVFEGVPVRLLTPDGSVGRCQLIPATVAVTLRGDPGLLNRLHADQIRAFAPLEIRPGSDVRVPLQVLASGFDVLEISPKEVLIRPFSPLTNHP